MAHCKRVNDKGAHREEGPLHLRPEALERDLDALGVLDVGDHGMQRQIGVQGRELVLQVVEPVLRVIEQQQFRRPDVRRLARLP